MGYNGIAWPGLTLSMKAINAKRANVVRWLKTLDENPSAFKQPKRVREKYQRMLADYDTGLKVLRDVQRAAEAPKAKGKLVRRVSVSDAMEGKIL